MIGTHFNFTMMKILLAVLCLASGTANDILSFLFIDYIVYCNAVSNKLDLFHLISVALADVGIKIFNGTNAFPGQFPYMAAIRVSIFTNGNIYRVYIFHIKVSGLANYLTETSG